MQRPSSETITLNDVLITQELSRRAPRPANLQAENQSMRSLAQQMARDSRSLMQTLVDTALELCRAGTAGVSLLEGTPDGEEIFRWNVLAGTLAHHVGGTTPRNFSPCGVCLEQGSPVLFSHPERYFTYFQAANTLIVEGLVLPLIADSHILGTIWIMSHDEGRHFDAEDVRVMTSLADFTATALLLQQRQTRELLAVNTALETEIAERKQVEKQTHALISNLPGGAAFVVDRDLRYLLAEGEALAIAGFKPDDFVGKTIFEVLPPDIAASYEPMYRKALAGEPFEHEHHAHNHTYLSRGTPLRAENGEIDAVLAISYDITDRKQAEEALREREARLALELADAKQLQFISSQLLQEETVDVLYEQILDAAIALTRSEMGSMQMLHPDSNELQLLVWKGFDPASAAFWEWVRVDSDSACGMALKTGERAIVSDVEAGDFRAGSGELDAYRHSGIRAVQTTPLICRKGRIVGMLSTQWREPHQPSERELALLDVLARQAADLIEQRQAEAALRESESRMQSITNLVPDLLWESEPDGLTNWYNQRWMEYTGQTFEQAIGWGWVDAIHPGDRAASARRYREAVKQGVPLQQEHRLRRHDGEYRWFVVNVFPLKDESGKVIKMYGAATDIHEVQVSLDALRESEEKFRTFVSVASDNIYEMSADWREMRFLEGKEFIASTENLRCDWTEEYIPEIDKPQVWAAINQAIATRSNFELEHRVIRLDGTVGWMFSRAIPLMNETGEIVKWFGAANDITKQKQAEAALRESEAKYRLLFNSMDEAYAVVEVLADDNGEWNDFLFLEVNPAFMKQTGMEYPVGRKATELLGTPNPNWVQTYGRVAETGEPIRFEEGEATLGRVFDLYVFRLGEDGSRRVAVLFTDITDRKRAEEALRESEEQQAFLLKFSDALRAEPDADAVANRAIRMLSEQMQLDRCYIGVYRLADDRGDFTHQVGNDRVPPLPDGVRLSDFPESLRVAFDRTLVINDIAEIEGLIDTDRQNLSGLGLRALVAATLRKGENNPLWSIVSVSAHPRRWTQGEIALIEEVTERTWAAMERTRAEAALRESEEKYRSLFNSMDEGYILCDVIFDENDQPIDVLYRDANPAAVRMTGTELVGRRTRELDPNFEPQWFETFGRVAKTSVGERHELYAAPLEAWYNFYVFKVGGANDTKVAAIYQDVTDRKRAEANLAFLAEISQDLVHLTNIDEMMDVIGEKTAAHFSASVCVFSVIDEAAGTFTNTHAWHRADVPRMLGRFRIEEYHSEEIRRAMRADETYFVNDTATDPRTNYTNMAALGTGSFLSVPLVRDGEWRFNLTIVDTVPRDWRNDEIELMRELTTRIWTRLERARAEESLRESEAKYRSLFTSIDDGFCIIERVEGELIDFRYLEANPAFAVQTGIGDVVGKTMREAFPDAPEEGYKVYENVLQTDESIRFEIEVSGIDRVLEIYAFRIDNEPRLAVIFKDITERKRAETQLLQAAEIDAFRVKLSDALRSLADPVQIQTQACCLLGEHLGVDRAYYVEINEDEGSARVNQHYSRGDSPSIIGDYRLVNYGWSLPLMRRGETIIIADTQTTNMIPDAERAAMAMITMIGFVAVPLIKGEVLVGALTVNEPAPREWSETEVELIRETAERIWATIQRAYAEAALRKSELQRIREQSAREQEQQRAEALAELDRAKTLFFSNISHEFRTPLTLLLAPLQDALSDRTLDPVHRERLELACRNSLRLLKLVNTLLDFSRIEAGRIEAVYEPTDLAQLTTDLASVFRSAIERAGLRLIVDCSPLPEPAYVDREMWEKIVLNLLSNALKFTFEGEITVSLRAESRAERQASTSNIHSLTSEPQAPSSDLEMLTSELETSTSELEISSSEPQTLTSELETSTSELETLSSELETLTSEPETSSLDPQTSHSPTPSHLHTHIILEIRDTGSGIPPEHLPHLFERFYQVRGVQARTHEGSGIGLALVYELVRLQGGAIAVSSTVGEGTCFTITLPFGTAHLPSERIQSTRTLTSTALGTVPYVEEAERWLPNDSDSPQPLLGREENSAEVLRAEEDFGGSLEAQADAISSAHVLIVDDNTDMREYLTRILSEYVQVEAVANGDLALSAIQAQLPDLVLSDVMMPGLDGFSLLQALRANPCTREIPVILLSARAGEEAIAQGLEAGADDYLIKPFSSQELVSRVNAHLQISSLRGEALHEARTAMRRKDELLSVVSHELNTPLVSILGWTRLLRANPPNPAMLSTALDTIERSAMMQAKLVQDLLDVSHITAGKLGLHLQPTELESVIEAAIATVTQLAAEKEIHLTWTGTVAAVVMGDQERLQQVVLNLLTNAIKFTPEGGSITVSLAIEGSRGNREDGEGTASPSSSPTPGNYAEIRVTDTGIGITSDFLPHVFEQFRQAEGTNSAKGLGLGLAIANHIVELHNGTIQAQSAGIGQGVTFLVSLPLLKLKINNS